LVELASWYLPGSPAPTTMEDVIAFLQAIQDSLDVFFKCFVPLRDGYKQFEVQMDIQRWRTSDEMPSKVETAHDPRELARAMLDWRTTTGGEPQTIASTFAELMTHQVAILNGVMKGVKSLLSELSPTTLERELENPSRGPRQGLQIGPFRFKQLWDLYVERHNDLSSEDNQAFALIFGPQFAEAYAQFSGGAPAAPGIRTTAVKVPNQVYVTVPPPARGTSDPQRR
jgi:type VI secretion system protein ImpI